MEQRKAMALFLVVVLLSGFCSASALSPARAVKRFLSNTLYALLKRLLSLSPATKGVISGRTGMKFESGYNIETVFDGTKSGIEPYSITSSPDGDLLVLDSANSNIYTISSPLSKHSRPKLFAGSNEGSTGHVDGRLREARLNRPKGFTMDDRGNIYVADTMNRAIRKISDLGITTIACEDAKLSNDFEVVYIQHSCSLLVVDRGNQVIREITLSDDDCDLQYIIPSNFPFGVLVVLLAIIFGYLLGLLQRKLTPNEEGFATKESNASQMQYNQQYNHPIRPSSHRPPLIQPDPIRPKKQELHPVPLYNAPQSQTNHTLPPVTSFGPAMFPMLGSFLSAFRRKKPYEPPNPMTDQSISNQAVIGSHGPGPRRNYNFASSDNNPVRLHRVKGGGRESTQRQQYMQRNRQYGPGPQTCYESTNEVVFGAVQECDRNGNQMDIRPINYGEPFYDQYNNVRVRRNQFRY